MIYQRIDWTNTESTLLNATNLNKMDKGIYDLEKYANTLEELTVYPNVSADCIKGNYEVTSGATLAVENGCLNITGSGNVINLSSDLSETKTIDTNRVMLLKLRMKKNSGTNVSIYPKYYTNTDEVYITAQNIIASNLYTAGFGNPQYIISDGVYHNIWCIFGSSTAVDIKGIIIELAPSPDVTISNIQLFYSMDKVDEARDTTVSRINTVIPTNSSSVITVREAE